MTTTTTDLNLRKGAGTSNPIVTLIPKGSTVTVTGDPWYPVSVSGQSGWVSGKYLDLGDAQPEPTGQPDYVSDAMALAKSMLGLYYRWGGNFTQEPFAAKRGDCSGYVGFVSYAMEYQPGSQPLYNYTADQMFDNFRTGVWPAQKIEPGHEQAMDFVFYGPDAGYAGHVVFAVGDGTVIGSSGGNAQTTSDAAAKARKPPACVRIDTLHFHSNPIVGIYRPAYGAKP